MKSNKEYIREDNLDRILMILNDDKLERLIKESDAEKSSIIEGDDIPEVIDDTYPGLLNIRMDTMKMNLFMDLKAPINSDNEITISDIKSQIEKFGPKCESSVDWEKVRDLYTRIMFDGELIPETIIAEGKPCTFNIPEYIVLKDGLNTTSKPYEIDGERVDYHHINSFIAVQKGEFLGNIVPELPGIDGENLLGHKIPFNRKVINNLGIGNNVTKESGKLYANIDGAFKIFRNKINIDEVLQINGDVDYTTGDISFKGDIFINNSIREGFNVECDRDLFVKDSIEATNIKTGNNITVLHGILGSKKYLIESEGTVTARHAENAQINATGCVILENGAVNCIINSLDKLIIGKNSAIIGGNYHIQNELICGNIGNSLGKETYIYMGIDYSVEKKLELVQKSCVSIVDEMNKLQSLIPSAESREKRDAFKFMFLKLKSKLNSLNNYSRALLNRLDKNDKSTITVLNNVYPGTYIEICHITYIVEKIMTRVKFSLDKKKGEIVVSYI